MCEKNIVCFRFYQINCIINAWKSPSEIDEVITGATLEQVSTVKLVQEEILVSTELCATMPSHIGMSTDWN